MLINLPEDVKKIINTIEAAGYEAYAVGGCVRDAALGRVPHDWDITTSADPYKVKALFKYTFDTGIQHGTVTVVLGGENYEVTTYRVDGDYADGRHPDKVDFTKSLEEDLKRRDFTINAMAYHPERGLVDLFDGIGDLEAKIVRCVGNPIDRFTEDALRMMRAVRFAAQLGFNIEENTYMAVLKLSDRLKLVSQERITDEMCKLLTSANPGMFIELYKLSLTPHFFPEFDQMMKCTQNTKYHCYTVGEHTLKVVENVSNDRTLRLAALLHDVGKLYTKTEKDGVEHFYGHAKVSSDEARKIIRRWRLDNDTLKAVGLLALYHDSRFEYTEKNVRKLMNKVGRELMPGLLALMEADLSGKSEYSITQYTENLKLLRTVYETIAERGDAVSISELDITGNDLMEHGVPKGKEIGETLNRLLELVLDDPTLNSKEKLIKKI